MLGRFVTLIALLCGVSRACAGSFFTDFEATPPRTRLYENAMINPGSGVNDSGVLRLTPAEQDRMGTFIVDDLDRGKPVAAFSIKFKLQIAGGRGADGLSVNVGSRLPTQITEVGTHNGFSLMFDTYVNNGAAAPELIPKYQGRILGQYPVPRMRTPGRFVDVAVDLNSNGVLNVFFDSDHKIKDLVLTGFKPIHGAQFGFGARTGGVADNHLIDDLSIITATEGQPLLPDRQLLVPLAKSAERAWFMNDSEVLQGCLYKPTGDGPFPIVILADGLPSDWRGDGTINPLPDLGGFFISKGYALFVPGGYDLDSGELQVVERQEKRLQSAAAWLIAQSFVDPNRIVVLGRDSVGILAALSGFSQEKTVRGIALVATESRVSPSETLEQKILGKISTATCPMILFYRAQHQGDPLIQSLAAGFTQKGLKCHPRAAAETDGVLTFSEVADDVFSFFRSVAP